jgi:hypothetical protein
MIGGAGNVPSKMARTKSRPDIAAITCVGVTPYSTLGIGAPVMGDPATFFVIASEAKQSIAPQAEGWIASSLRSSQ